jgi:hypothetical protein
VAPNTRNIADVATAGLEIRLIGVERFPQRRRLRDRMALLGGGTDLRFVLGLPVVEDGLTIRLIVIVGDPDGVGPVAALAVGDPDDPGAGGPVSSIAQADAGVDPDKDRLLSDRQAETG